MSKNKLFKFIIAGIFIFVIGILQSTYSNATTYSSAKDLALYGKSGDKISINLNKVINGGNLYCINHSGHLTTKHDTTYTVKYKISIDGTTASCNGNKVTSMYNAWLAYILGGGNYPQRYGVSTTSQSVRQKALWEFWDDWNSYIGVKLGARVNDDNDENKLGGEANKLYYEAKAYAENEMSGGSSINLISANKIPKKDNNGKLYGPFRVKYTGGIKSIVIIGSDGSNITSKITIRNASGTTVYKDLAWVGNSGLPNNQDFYIYLDNGSQNENENLSLKSITLTAQANNVIKADICVLTSNETPVDGNNSQRLIAVSTSNGPGEESSITIDEIITETELIVEKIDSASLEALEGAKFLLHHKNKFAQANDLGNGVYQVTNWTDNKDDATKFVIGKSGIKIKIQRDDEILYALTEVEAPPGYEKSIGINNYTGVTLSSEYGNGYGIELSEKNGSKIYFELKYQKTAKMILTNSKKVSLIINKVDADDKNIKINKVEFYFKHRNQYAVASFEDATGHYTVVGWTKDEKEATKFITGNNIDDGQLIIDFAEDGTDGNKKFNRFLYGLEEVNNPDKDYDKTPIFIEGTHVYENSVEDNKILFLVNCNKSSDGAYVYTYNDTANLTIGNKKPETRIITIKKVSSADGTTPVNATFVLAHHNSYAGLQKNSEGIYEIVNWYPYVREEYNLNSKEVTKLKLENGEAKIKVPYDTELYALIEVATENNYNLNMTYLSDKSSNITPFDGTSKVWSSERGIDKNGILNNYEVDNTITSQFYFYLNKDTNKDAEIKISLTNESKEYATGSITGYVWLDTINNKINLNNNLYDNGESRIEGVRVSLIDSSTDREVAHAYTNSNGEYNFNLGYNAITTNIRYGYRDYTVTFKNDYVKPIRNYCLKFDYTTLYKLKNVSSSYRYISRYDLCEDLYGNTITSRWDIYYDDDYYYYDSVLLFYDKTSGYSNYIPVDDSYEANGSKGISLYNEYGRIPGTAYIWFDDALIKKFYNNQTHTLSNMNLGIIYDQKLENFPIKEQLEYVKIVMNNYTYYYEYGANGIASNAPSVKFQNETITKYYSRPIYPSDVYKSIATNWNNRIKVYAVYSMTITNPITRDNRNYSEKYMEVISLQNIYDNARYKLCSDVDQYSINRLGADNVKDFGYWKDSGNSGTATYNNYSSRTEAIGRQCGHMHYSYQEHDYVTGCTLNSLQSVTKFIQFELTEKAIQDILTDPSKITLKYPTTAYAKGKHYYGYTGKHWVSTGKGEGYYCTYSGRNHTSEQDAKDTAPYLLFSTGEERIITGTVFNDNVVTDNGEVLGDGVYNSGDGTVENVKVELILANNSYNYKNEPVKTDVATIYNKEHPEGTQASMITTSDGNFKFEGIPPGQYYIKFTYPDGTTKIYNNDGTTTDVKINDYKSTIVTDGKAKDAILMCENILNDADSLGWYRDLQDASHSVAVDNLKRRETYNSEYWNNKYNDSHPDVKITDMIAGTAIFEIKVENKDVNSSENLKEGSAIHEYTYQGFNFGIVRQPIQKASIEKVINNVKLVNGPQTIYDGNPNEKPGNGVTDLDGNKDNKGSTYTRIEVAEDTLYGATLTLTYELRVNNESELNYYEVGDTHKGYYYMFGEVYDDTKVVELYTNVEDYLDKNLTYSANTTNAKLIDGKYGISVDKIIAQNKSEITQIGNTGNPIDVKDTILYTLEYNNFIQKDKTETVLINSYKTLSEQEEEWNYDNSARIKILANKPNKNDLNDDGTEKNPTSIGIVITPTITEPSKAETKYEYISTTETVVTTPTGLDKKTIVLYISTGVIALIILSAGIIIIKKKIL